MSAASRTPPFDLIVITDPALRDPVELCRQLVQCQRPARLAIQLRAKAWSAARRRQAAVEMRSITRAAGTALLINGDPDLCAAVGAEGMQRPEGGAALATVRATLGANAWIGASCHDAQGLARAAADGADFLLLSPWGHVPDKGIALGPEVFAQLAHGAALPIYALGGLGLPNIHAAIASGAHGIAVIRDVHQARSAAAWIERALDTIDDARRRLRETERGPHHD